MSARPTTCTDQALAFAAESLASALLCLRNCRPDAIAHACVRAAFEAGESEVYVQLIADREARLRAHRLKLAVYDVARMLAGGEVRS